MNNPLRICTRPPLPVRLPRSVPLSRFNGVTPTSLAMKKKRRKRNLTRMALLLGVIGVMAICCFFFHDLVEGMICFCWEFYFDNCGGKGGDVWA